MSYHIELPAGVILPFAGNNAPYGCLMCDGAAVSRTQYARLYAQIGTAHGQGDGVTTFNLPDFRGRFLRGTDNMNTARGAAGRDPDVASRSAAASGGNLGNAVGSVQSHATARNGLGVSISGTNLSSSISGTTGPGYSTGTGSSSHNHTATTSGTTAVGGTSSSAVASGGSFFTTSGSIAGITISTATVSIPSLSLPQQSVSGSANPQPWNHTGTSWSGDNETRPQNININYIITI